METRSEIERDRESLSHNGILVFDSPVCIACFSHKENRRIAVPSSGGQQQHDTIGRPGESGKGLGRKRIDQPKQSNKLPN